MTDGAARAWGWVAHLRDGGTTPWRDWSAGAEPSAARLPGAQQLELLRRMNLADPAPADLVARVFAADPPRRSRPGLPLAGGPPVPDHGPRPIDPAQVDDNELARLTAVLLAEDLAASPLPEPRRAWPRPWRIRYHLLGDPEYVGGLRRHLAARGRPEGGVGQVLVIGTDTGRMLVDVWTAHCFRNGSLPWQEWVDQRAGRGAVPTAIDLHHRARSAAELPTTREVRVVTDPALASRLVGVRRGPTLPPPPAAAIAVDAGRRVSGALRPLVAPGRRARLTSEVLRPRLAGVPGLPLVVPARHRDWVHAEAERLHRELSAARYPVHGDPALVLPVDRAGVEAPEITDVLALTIRMLLAGTLRGEPTKEEP